MTGLILHCKSTSSGWAQSGHNISQKNVISHPPHPAGHQAQYGGVRLHGLRVGRHGTSIVWQDDKWSEQWVRQPRTRGFRRSRTSIQETGAIRLKTTSSTLSPSTRKPDRMSRSNSFFFRSCWSWVSHSASNSRECDGGCRHHTHLYARQTHIFLVRTSQCTIHSTLPTWAHRIASR